MTDTQTEEAIIGEPLEKYATAIEMMVIRRLRKAGFIHPITASEGDPYFGRSLMAGMPHQPHLYHRFIFIERGEDKSVHHCLNFGPCASNLSIFTYNESKNPFYVKELGKWIDDILRSYAVFFEKVGSPP